MLHWCLVVLYLKKLPTCYSELLSLPVHCSKLLLDFILFFFIPMVSSQPLILPAHCLSHPSLLHLNEFSLYSLSLSFVFGRIRSFSFLIPLSHVRPLTFSLPSLLSIIGLWWLGWWISI